MANSQGKTIYVPLSGDEVDRLDLLVGAVKEDLPRGARLGQYAVAHDALMLGIEQMLAERNLTPASAG